MKETEIWKDVPGFPGYRCSNLGQVMSYRRKLPHVLSQTLHDSNNPDGYLSVTLHDKDGHPSNWFVHRVVAMTFLPDFDTQLTVNHQDGNKQNNHVSNLEMMTSSDNTADFQTNDVHADNRDRWKEKLSERATERYSDPEERKKTGAAISKTYREDEEARRNKSEASKRNWTNPETRDKIISAMKERTLSEDQKENLKNKSLSLWQDEEYRKKNLQSRLGKKFIYNPSTDVQTVVKIEDLTQYTSQGWIVGKRPHKK